MEKVQKDLKELDTLGVTYCSVKINGKLNADKRIVKDIVKNTIIPYRDVKLDKYYNKNYNASMIPLGKRYNLIGIDVDNKEDTIKKYNKILSNNKHQTLTMSTCNGGFHYYYKLSERQKGILEEHDFKSMNDAIFGLHIDIKYTNQIFYGPTVLTINNTDYFYSISKRTYPITLPSFIFDELIKNITKPVKKVVNEKVREPINNVEIPKKVEESDEDDIKRLKLYLDCLNTSRFDEYQSWFKIGSIIYNEKGTLELFHAYSKLSKKYDKVSCDRQWAQYKNNKNKKIGIATLISYAKEDNINKFRKATLLDKNNIIYKIFEQGHNDTYLANIFYLNNSDNIIYDEKNKEWYVLNQYNIWDNESSHEISRLLSEQLEKELRNAYSKDVKNNIPNLKLHSSNWSKAKNHILNNRTKKGVVEILIEYYKNKRVYELFDSVNNYLFAFTNGVYDLKGNEFRLPHPTEYIYNTCGYDYVEEDEDQIDYLYKVIRRMFKTREEMAYVLTTIAVCLSGCNNLEKFYIWKGIGRNGKGVLGELIYRTFGKGDKDKYSSSMDVVYLDSRIKKNANAADEILASKKNARIVISTEPESNMPIKTNKIKEWSGRDTIQTRGINGKAFSFRPKFTLIIQTNHDITFGDNGSKALSERLSVIDFPFSFVENPKSANEKKLDRTLKDRLDQVEYALSFFHILLHHYRLYVENNNNIEVPDTIRELTEMYLLENDPFIGFYEDILECTNDTKVYVTSSELMDAYKRYMSNSEYNFNYAELKSSMINKGIKPSGLKGKVVYRGVSINFDKINKVDFVEED